MNIVCVWSGGGGAPLGDDGFRTVAVCAVFVCSRSIHS